MALPAVVFGAQLLSSYFSGQNAQAMNQYNQAVADANAQASRNQAKRVLQAGIQQERASKNATNQMLGRQRVSMAAQGIDVSTGNALDIQEQTVQFGIEDAQIIRNNAFLEAMGYEQQAINYKAQANISGMAESNKVSSSLIGAGISYFGGAAGQSNKSKAVAISRYDAKNS